METVANGHLVTVHYTGRLDTGEIFDSSEDREPLKFVIGRGTVIPGFENGIIGMSVGQQKKVVVPPSQGYGERNEKRMVRIDQSRLEGHQPRVGMHMQVELSDGRLAIATITAIENGKVTLDLNHPLAGRTLTFDIRLLEIADGSTWHDEECCGEHDDRCCGEHGDSCCG